MRVSIILPTYNERENIVSLVESLSEQLTDHAVDYEIVIVDDNSPDGTAEAVGALCRAGAPVKVIVRTEERGLATAIKTGIGAATGEVVLIMDADFSHDPKDALRLVSRAQDYDIVNGSRFLKGGGFEVRTVGRVMCLVMNRFLRLVLRLKNTDNTMGFLAIKKSMLSHLDLDRIFYGYGDFHIRLMYHAARNGATVLEVPVVYKPRRGGRTKTRLLRNGWGYVVSAVQLRLGIEPGSPTRRRADHG